MTPLVLVPPFTRETAIQRSASRKTVGIAATRKRSRWPIHPTAVGVIERSSSSVAGNCRIPDPEMGQGTGLSAHQGIVGI